MPYVLSSFKYAESALPAKVDAIVLLGGHYPERLPAAATLYKQGYSPRVIVANDGVLSRWSSKYSRNLWQAEWAKEGLVNSGVPGDRIVILPFYGSATMYDALAVKEYASQHSLHSLIVATSDRHARRASWTFKKVFSSSGTAIHFFPAVTFNKCYKDTIMEYVKILYYAVRYSFTCFEPRAVSRGGAEVLSETK